MRNSFSGCCHSSCSLAGFRIVVGIDAAAIGQVDVAIAVIIDTANEPTSGQIISENLPIPKSSQLIGFLPFMAASHNIWLSSYA